MELKDVKIIKLVKKCFIPKLRSWGYQQKILKQRFTKVVIEDGWILTLLDVISLFWKI